MSTKSCILTSKGKVIILLMEVFDLQKNHLLKLLLILFITVVGFQGCHSFENKSKAKNTVPNHTDSLLVFREQIINLLRQSNSKEAIKLLIKSGDVEVKLLKERLDLSDTNYEMGLIDFAAWDIEQNRINFAILELIPKSESKSKQISIEELNMLINAGNVESALNLLVDSGNEDAILWQASYLRAKKQLSNGLIGSADFNLVNARIRYAISNYLEMNKK